MTAEARFAAMGSHAHVLVSGATTERSAAELVDMATQRIEQLESLWSRFRPDSEVNELNRRRLAREVDPELSSETRLLLDRAAAAHRLTNGRFDPYMVEQVKDAGYDDHFRAPLDTAPRVATPAAGFDPGGIGKGLAADIVAEELIETGATGALVNLGGDIRLVGTAPDGADWRIDIEDPRTGGILSTVVLAQGAVATSSLVKRRWIDGDGEERHHLIDPITEKPSASVVLAVTVIAASAWQAEVLCKPLVLDWNSPDPHIPDPMQLIESLGASAMVVTKSLHATTSTWASFEMS